MSDASARVEAARVEHAVATEETAFDYLQHEKTYAGFTHVVKWFCVHLLFDLVGLYFLVIQGNWLVGIGLVLLGTLILVIGNLTTPAVAERPTQPKPLD